MNQLRERTSKIWNNPHHRRDALIVMGLVAFSLCNHLVLSALGV